MHLSPDLLVESIILYVSENDDKTRDLVQGLIALYDKEMESNPTLDDTQINLLLDVLKDITSGDVDVKNKTERLTILINLLGKDIYTQEESKLYVPVLKEILESDESISEIKGKSIRKKIFNAICTEESASAMKKLYGSLNKAMSVNTPSHQERYFNKFTDSLSELQKSIADIGSRYSEDQGKANLEEVDLSDVESIRFSVKKNLSKRRDNVLKTGLQGLNRMLGPTGGFSIGESACFCALSHNYKSGMLLSLARWLVQYNEVPKPVEGDPFTEGKPCILFISLENEAHENIMEWFNSTWGQLNNCPPPPDMTEDEIVEFVHEQFRKSGYKLFIVRRPGGEFSVADFKNLYNEYVDAGYNVVSAIVDYVMCMDHGGIGGDVSAPLVRHTVSSLCNFCKDRSTLLLTAHQLTRDVAKLESTGQRHVVKKFGPAHIAYSFDVMREIDFMCFLHIESNQYDMPFLTMHWGKHRHVPATRKEDLFCAYPFQLWGIKDDIYCEDMSVNNIYAVKPEGEESNEDAAVEKSAEDIFA